MSRAPRRRRRIGKALFILCVVLIGAIGLGLSGNDYAALLAFSQGATRWQTNPEFRQAAKDYCVLGSASLQARPFGFDAGAAMMKLRALPGIPKGFEVNPTSQAHYDNFSAGPLRAYLHLCGEQSLQDWIPVIEEFARKPNKANADYQAWLAARQMDYAVAHDDGAAVSMSLLLQETHAGEHTFAVRQNIPTLLRPQIAALAKELNIPPEPERMSYAEQGVVFDRLDSYLKLHDPELWRTKQINDFCGGIWAQVYGKPYNVVLIPVTRAHVACRYLFFAIVLAWLWLAIRKVRAVRPPQSTEEDRAADRAEAAIV